MADEEIVAGLGRVENQLVQQRTEDSKQTSQLSETINNLRAENSQKSDNLANVITTGLERNASEVASDRAIAQENQAFLRESGVTQIDDKLDNQTAAQSTANTEQKTFLQRIATFVSPNMRGSKDREEQNETLLNRKKQLEFFSNMSKSLKGMVVRPIKATASGIKTFMQSLAIGGAVLGLLAFLDSDMWKSWKKWIADELPKKLIAIKEGFVDKEGNVTFLKGLKVLAIQLGLWNDGINEMNSHLSTLGIAGTILGIMGSMTIFGAAWQGIKSAMGLGPAAAASTTGGGKTSPARTGTIPATQPGRSGRAVVQASPGGPWTDPKGGIVSPAEAKRVQVTPVEAPPPGGKGTKPAGLAKRAEFIYKKVPFLGRFLGLYDLIKIIKDPKMDTAAKVGQIGLILSRLGGSVLGGLAGTMIAAPFGMGLFSPVTGALGLAAGSYLGYKYGPETATAFAQYLLGEKVTAYDGVVKAWKDMFGMGDGGNAATEVPNDAAAEPSIMDADMPAAAGKINGSGGTAVLKGGGAGDDTLGVTPLPTSGAAVAAAGTGLNAASRAATSTAMGDTTPIISAPNIVNNNQSNTTIAAKQIANASGILQALNYSYG